MKSLCQKTNNNSDGYLMIIEGYIGDYYIQNFIYFGRCMVENYVFYGDGIVVP